MLPYSYAGTMGLLQYNAISQRFFNVMGASDLARTICSEAGFEGYLYTIGATEGMEPDAYAASKLILIWGSNILTSNVHLWNFIQDARKAGGKVIVIDPARTRTARAADEWIPIHPGTDGALALAMMHVIIAEGLHDADYVARYTVGFDELSGTRAPIGHPNAPQPSPVYPPPASATLPVSMPPSNRRRSASTMACNATQAAAWPSAPLPAYRPWSAHGDTRGAASN